MKRITVTILIALQVMGQAQALTAVRPIDGYVCMNLKWEGTEAEMWEEAKMPSVYAEPSPKAKRIGSVGSIAIVAFPLHVVNGYAEILHLNGKKGWVEAGLLEPYKVPGRPNATCIPSIMSDGRIGTDGS